MRAPVSHPHPTSAGRWLGAQTVNHHRPPHATTMRVFRGGSDTLGHPKRASLLQRISANLSEMVFTTARTVRTDSEPAP